MTSPAWAALRAYFYPRPPRGGRQVAERRALAAMLFLSTPSARRATLLADVMSFVVNISIHALREEGDTPPQPACAICSYFYPRPPRGGRLDSVRTARASTRISIHALREEGDGCCQNDVVEEIQFLSTPSARRATILWPLQCDLIIYFYPRPPRGGRRVAVVKGDLGFYISIHALREEGDSKNGEKHLRFCFTIKRSAQIWKSLSKNIRKKSRDLHRTA